MDSTSNHLSIAPTAKSYYTSPTPPSFERIVNSACQLRVNLPDGKSLFICSGTLTGPREVETSFHGLENAISLEKKNNGLIVMRFAHAEYALAESYGNPTDDLSTVTLDSCPPIKPAPPKGPVPTTGTPIVIVHSPRGRLCVDKGTTLPSANSELVHFGDYPSDEGSCGGSLYYQTNSGFVRIGHHRYASRINDGVKSFGTTPTPDLIMGGDKLADRLFDDIYGRANHPRLIRDRPQPSVSIMYSPQLGPDVPEDYSHNVPLWSIKEGLYRQSWSTGYAEHKVSRNDYSRSPIRGIDVTVRSKILPNSKKKKPGTNGIPNNQSYTATFIVSPNPHEVSSYAKKPYPGCKPFYDTLGVKIATHRIKKGTWPKEGFKIKAIGRTFRVYFQEDGSTTIVDDLASGKWYDKKPSVKD